MQKFFKPLALVAVIVCAVAAFATSLKAQDDTNPDGSIKLQSAILFSVLTAADFSATDNTFTGPSYVKGNVGIGGKGNFSWSDGTIEGDVYMNSYGAFTKSGPAKFTGGGQLRTNQDITLTKALTDIKYLSDQAWNDPGYTILNYGVNSMTATTSPLTTVNTGKNMDIYNTGPGSKVVLRLQDFVLTGGTFTLHGTAMTTYIINVKNNFSINNAKVILRDGLLASHVLFNVRNTGSQVSLNQGTQLSGNLVAMQRKVALSGGTINGRLYANQVAITSGGQVISQ